MLAAQLAPTDMLVTSEETNTFTIPRKSSVSRFLNSSANSCSSDMWLMKTPSIGIRRQHLRLDHRSLTALGNEKSLVSSGVLYSRRSEERRVGKECRSRW